MDIAILIRVCSKADQQEYNRQVKSLSAWANENNWNIVKIIVAYISGSKSRRSVQEDISELYDLVRQRAIQKILVTELTSLGNKSKEICQMFQFLTDKDISIYIHSLGLDTGLTGPFQKAVCNLITTILTEITEQERMRLSERIKSGLQKAKAEGKIIGRPKGTTVDFANLIENKAQYKSARWLLKRGVSLRRTASLAGIAVNTVRKIKKTIKEEEKEVYL